MYVLWNVHIIDQNNHTWRGDYDIMLYRAIALQDNCDEPEQAAHSHAPHSWITLFSLRDWVIIGCVLICKFLRDGICHCSGW